MFTHNFKYTFKTLLKNKALIFWTFAFPIILGTFFNMAFSNITKSEKLDIIKIAIVNNEEFNNNEIFSETFKILSDKKNSNQLFDTKYVNEEEAASLLNNDKIDGYMKLVDDNPSIVVSKRGINQTIFKYVTEEISQNDIMINNLAQNEIQKQIEFGDYNINYDKIYTSVYEMISANNVKLKDISSKKIDFVMIEFYTLIAMTCLYGGTIAMVAINNSLANMGNIGKRVSIAPTKKSIVILSSLAASYIIQLLGILLLFIYTIFVLKVDYGNNIPLIILLAFIGSLAGLSMGVAVGTTLKANEGVKVGVLLGITMLGSFLSGMMGITLKYYIDRIIPFINKINPAAMITDGFYALYYYTNLNRYWFNIISLLIISFVLIVISFIQLRRQKYDSI